MNKESVSERSAALHPITWVVWTGVTAACVMLVDNPLYLMVLLGVVGVQYLSASTRQPQERGWGTLLRMGLWLILLVVPLNALSIHAGSHVLFRLPEHWPLVGGRVTWEGVIAGAVNALSLFSLLVLFACFNLEITQAQLLRLTPAFVYEAGLVLSIGLTFVPQMMVSAREIREAQRVRGHRMRRVRDALPFVMALLTTGLERSFALAESMEARGFGRARSLPRRLDLWYRALAVLGLVGVLCGLFLQTYYASWRVPGWILAATSTAVLLVVFWGQGRRVLRVHYRRERWTWRDGVVVAICTGVVGLVLIGGRALGALAYSPYQDLVPVFNPGIGVVLILLLAPLVVRLVRL
jgi:energy-coupling factor transport system permease protein